jgi:Tol biopolymer transport system component
VVLWEMLKGEQLFGDVTVSDTLVGVLSKEPDFTRAPVKVRRLLQACLQKDPKLRLRGIGDWHLLLDEARPASPAPARARRLPWAIAAAALIVAAFARWGWLHQTPTVDSRTYNLEIAPPDGESLYQDAQSGFQAISPDGRTLAFIAESKGTRHIWVRPLDSPVARPLSGTELTNGLFWSPDSRNLGFTASTKLHRIDIATGAIKEIYDAGQFIRGASWNADGTIIFGAASRPIERVSADGGSFTPVTFLDRDRELNHIFPQFLPDGRHFLYLIHGVQEAASGIYIGSLDDDPGKQQKARIVATIFAAMYATSAGSAGHLLFLQGKTLFAQPFDPNRLTLGGAPHAIAENVGARGRFAQISVSQTGLLALSTAGNLARSVAIVSRDGKTIATVGNPDAFEMSRLSPDGRTLALVLPSSGVNHIWLMDLTRGVPTPFTNDAWLSSYPTWSPDGKEIAFASNRGRAYRMYRKPVAGDGEEHLIQATETTQIPGAWSRDGKAILYTERNRDRNEFSLRLSPLAHGSAQITLASRVVPGAALSPSGGWVAYPSLESGGEEIYVQAMPGGPGTVEPKVRISKAGGALPAWSADGNELYFNSPDDRLMAVSVKYSGGRFEAGEPRELFPLGSSSSFLGAVYWQPIGNGQRFVVLRSAPVTSRDNRINIIMNWDRKAS